MKHLAFYDTQTRQVTATVQMHPTMAPDPAGDPWVAVPDGIEITDPREWEVTLEGEISYVGRPVTVADVTTERDRRLSEGFDYDFADVRGIHRIGTAPGDMEKWVGEVSPIAQAYLNLGNPAGEIEIQTETGKVIVTALEWQHILAAAMAVRQPIFQGYFDLKAMNPIPENYEEDYHWQGSPV